MYVFITNTFKVFSNQLFLLWLFLVKGEFGANKQNISKSRCPVYTRILVSFHLTSCSQYHKDIIRKFSTILSPGYCVMELFECWITEACLHPSVLWRQTSKKMWYLPTPAPECVGSIYSTARLKTPSWAKGNLTLKLL
jgi:hypothetical protein